MPIRPIAVVDSASAMAEASSSATRHTASGSNGPFARRVCLRVAPATYSNTRKGPEVGSSPTS